MSKNQNKHNKQRALILLKGFIPSFIGIFIPKIKNRIIFNSSWNEAYDFNSRYLFEYFIKYHSDYEVKFVMNDDEKREKLNQRFGIENNYFIETKTLKGMWYALKARAWIISAFETPVGGFFLRFNRIVYHLGHGAYFKSAMCLEKNRPLIKRVYHYLIKNNFSHHLLTSPTLAKIGEEMFACGKSRIVTLGEPMTDAVFTPDIELLKEKFGNDITEKKNVLYMPTWRPEGGLELFPFADKNIEDLVKFLEEHNINLHLRLHPQFEEDISFYTDKSNNIKVLNSSVAPDVNDVIGFFDLVITDYSSGHLGYLLTYKPVMFLPYDLEEYEKRVGFVLPYDEITPGPKPNTMKEFIVEIEKLLSDKNYYLEERKIVSEIFNKYSRDNSKMNAEFIIKELL